MASSDSSGKRHANSNLWPFAKALVNFEGVGRIVAIMVYGGAAAYATTLATADMFRDGPHDDSWSHYIYIAWLWFVINISLALLGAVVDTHLFCPAASEPRFDKFPIFAWQAPAAQQAFFFWPVSVFILTRVLSDSPGPLYQVMSHGLASHFGMQARELVLFDSDVMMTLHHVVTMALSALVWYGDQSFADDQHAIALTALSISVMEAGSLGFGVWTIWSSGTAFFVIMTTSHVVSCYAGFSLLYRHPDNAIFWVVMVLTMPLIYMRQTTIAKELKKGSPSGDRSKQREESVEKSK